MEIVDILDLEVLTVDGFKDFSGIKKTTTNSTLKIFFSTSHIECTQDHLLLKDDVFVEANTLQVGDILSGNSITSIEKIYKGQYVYDLLNVADVASYITNEVVSHNCAFVQNWNEFFASVFPTISSGNTTKILLTSTPNGLNHFHKICDGAKKDRSDSEWNGYEYVEVSWDKVPGRDEAWKKETLSSMNFDLQKFDQEFCCQFQGSSGTLISGAKLTSLVTRVPLKDHLGMCMYEIGVPGHNYVIVVDVSRGKGLDYSAFQVIDVTVMPYVQVCVYRDNTISPAEYAEVLYRTGKTYNDASILIEINDGVGEQISDLLYFDLEYENVLFTESAGRSGKKITSGFGGKHIDKGIRTTTSVKATGCAILKLLIEQDQLIIKDFNTISELSTFSRKGKSYEAESGKHDDLVMCLVLFAWLSEQKYFKEFTDINTLSKLREKSEEEIMEDLSSFGFFDDGIYKEEEVQYSTYF